MDPHEILGVRPNAGREEIELAYKGRRSQYHPDRYAQSDAETQAWATAKMKEVNEAYRALIRQGARTGFEQRRASSESSSQPKSREYVASRGRVGDVASVLLRPEWKWPYDNTYTRPNIPERKLEGAIDSYAPNVRPSEVIVLLDDTVFGGAREGLLVTNDAIYCKQKFESPRRILLNEIEEIEPEASSRLMINGSEFFRANVVEHFAVLSFAYRMQEVFKQGGECVDVEKNSGEKFFSQLKQGFYRSLEVEAQNDIAIAGEWKERVTSELSKQLLWISRSLERFIQRRGVLLSEGENRILSSDQLRFEVLTFAMMIVERILCDEIDLEEDRAAAVMAIVVVWMMRYIMDAEGIGGRQALHNLPTKQQLIELQNNSGIYSEFQRRWLNYRNSSVGEAAEKFGYAMKSPAAFHGENISESMREHLNEHVREFINRVLGEQERHEFIISLFKETAEALINVFDESQ